MKKYTLFALFMIFGAFVHSQEILGDLKEVPQGQATLIDDFEKGNYWIWAAFDWEQWGPAKLSTSARVSKAWASQGKSSLECKMIASYPGSGGDATYYMDHHWDFSGSKYLVFDVYNPEKKPFSLAIIFQTTENWVWNEFTNVQVKPGKHTVVLSLESAAKNLSLVQRINISYREMYPMEGRFYIDNMRLIK